MKLLREPVFGHRAVSSTAVLAGVTVQVDAVPRHLSDLPLVPHDAEPGSEPLNGDHWHPAAGTPPDATESPLATTIGEILGTAMPSVVVVGDAVLAETTLIVAAAPPHLQFPATPAA